MIFFWVLFSFGFIEEAVTGNVFYEVLYFVLIQIVGSTKTKIKYCFVS